MTKILIAHKCKDGWIVWVKTAYIVKVKSEVLDMVRYEGLKVMKKTSAKNRIYAR